MKRIQLPYAFLILVALMTYALVNEAQGSEQDIGDNPFGQNTLTANPDVKWQVMANGGIRCLSTHFIHVGTIGQTVTGRSKTTHMHIGSGFLLALSDVGRSCCQAPGDANDDGVFNNGDAVFIVNYIFRAGAAPQCLTAADANYDCNINIGDALYIINCLFRGGPQVKCSQCM